MNLVCSHEKSEYDALLISIGKKLNQIELCSSLIRTMHRIIQTILSLFYKSSAQAKMHFVMKQSRSVLLNSYSSQGLVCIVSMESISLPHHGFSLALHRYGILSFFIFMVFLQFYLCVINAILLDWTKCLGYQELGLSSASSSLPVSILVDLFITFVQLSLFISIFSVAKFKSAD